jgi:hypothetical protein
MEGRIRPHCHRTSPLFASKRMTALVSGRVFSEQPSLS